MTQLRLLLFEECNRKCVGCCNKDWDLDNLLICKYYEGYDLIMLTGGEPMLKPEVVVDTCYKIRRRTNTEIILYTAKVDNRVDMSVVTPLIDGLTLTLHSHKDIKPFLIFSGWYSERQEILHLKLRLNIFKEVGEIKNIPEFWKVKDNIEWIDKCPLPKDEVFMRLPKF